MANWLNFIEKWSGNMDILELAFEGSYWSRPIRLPNLKELRINVDLWMSYEIAAPKVERVYFLSFNGGAIPARDKILRSIDYARASFPALRRVKFVGLEGYSYQGKSYHHDLTSSDICNLIQAGLEVDIPPVQLA
jgi:hypothetical protein